MVSIGTGTFGDLVDSTRAKRMTSIAYAYHTLQSMRRDSQSLVLTMMQWFGDSEMPWRINSEIGDLGNDFLAGKPLFAFQRYDIEIAKEWITEELGIDLTFKQTKELREMDNAGNTSLAYSLAKEAAKRQVKTSHFPSVFDLVLDHSKEQTYECTGCGSSQRNRSRSKLITGPFARESRF